MERKNKMRKILAVLSVLCFAMPVHAQYSASKNAQYVATLKAVVNYKIDDEEIVRDVDRLRGNQTFVMKLQKKLEKLDNRRTKDNKNRKILKILEKAGEDIDRILD